MRKCLRRPSRGGHCVVRSAFSAAPLPSIKVLHYYPILAWESMLRLASGHDPGMTQDLLCTDERVCHYLLLGHVNARLLVVFFYVPSLPRRDHALNLPLRRILEKAVGSKGGLESAAMVTAEATSSSQQNGIVSRSSAETSNYELPWYALVL